MHCNQKAKGFVENVLKNYSNPVFVCYRSWKQKIGRDLLEFCSFKPSPARVTAYRPIEDVPVASAVDVHR